MIKIKRDMEQKIDIFFSCVIVLSMNVMALSFLLRAIQINMLSVNFWLFNKGVFQSPLFKISVSSSLWWLG
jgi:hypothetical protein